MKNILVFLFISIIPLLINAKDSKPFSVTDTIQFQKKSISLNTISTENNHNDSIRYNMIKIAGILYVNEGDVAIMLSLGYEMKISKHISYEIIGSLYGYGSDAAYSCKSIRAGVKYYFTKKHNPYLSLFLRYQKFDYANDDINNNINTANGYGVGGMLGSMLKFSNTVKMDIGMGLFYSYRVPAYNHQFDESVIGLGIYLIPRIHLSFCF